MEIYGVDTDASLRHHVSCHRAVNPAGQQKHRTSVGSQRHPARSRDHFRIDINLASQFDIQHNIRMVHINRQSRVSLQDAAPYLGIYFHGLYRELFIGPAGMDFKCFFLPCIHLSHIMKHILRKRLQPVIFHDHHRTDADDAEDSAKRFYSFFIVKRSFCLHIDAALVFCYLEMPFHRPQYFFYPFHQRVFKNISVLSLHADLAIFNQKSLKHIFPLLSICAHSAEAPAEVPQAPAGSNQSLLP